MVAQCHRIFAIALLVQCLASCTSAPPVGESRDALWKQYAHQPLDKLLLEWGAPASETRLTSGARMVAYRHATTYESGGSVGCEVTFLAPPPSYRIHDIAMTGSAYECSLLAQGQRGERHINDLPPPVYAPFYRYPY